MRVSTYEDDPGFANIDPLYWYKVVFNNHPVGDVYTADDKEHFIIRAQQPLRVEDNAIPTEKLYGKVKIYKQLKEIK